MVMADYFQPGTNNAFESPCHRRRRLRHYHGRPCAVGA
jgi:hypothetical protein